MPLRPNGSDGLISQVSKKVNQEEKRVRIDSKRVEIPSGSIRPRKVTTKRPNPGPGRDGCREKGHSDRGWQRQRGLRRINETHLPYECGQRRSSGREGSDILVLTASAAGCCNRGERHRRLQSTTTLTWQRGSKVLKKVGMSNSKTLATLPYPSATTINS